MTTHRIRLIVRLFALAWLFVFALYCAHGAPVYGQRPEFKPGGGLKYNDPTAAAENVRYINSQLAMRPPRTVQLTNVYVDPKGGTWPARLYLAGTIKTQNVVGCGRIECDGSSGYGGVDNAHPTMGGGLLQIVQLGKVPSLDLSGAGFVCEDPLEWIGCGVESGVAIVEVEGRASVAAGGHRFRNQHFTRADVGIKALAGYYDATGKFVADENHADTSIVDACNFLAVKAAFRSFNQQAVGWKFINNAISSEGEESVFADLIRGGGVTITDLLDNHPRLTIFRLHEYSPNNAKLICRSVSRDRFAEGYLTIIDYVGEKQGSSWCRWSLDVDAFIPIYETKFDKSRMFRGCGELPFWEWKIRFDWGLPNE